MTWVFVISDSAVLQGAFLLADKLCLPASLASVHKGDWLRVGRPVVEALRETCHPQTHDWKHKVICVVWLKLLASETGEDLERAWREDPLFPLQNGLPQVSHVVLLELVKSAAAADVFAKILLRLPLCQICYELERLTKHVMSSPVSDGDVKLLLDVWWELWKGRDEQGDTLDRVFANQSSGVCPRGAKRLKLEPPSPTSGVLHILLSALNDMKAHISSADLCLQALTVSLDSVYTSFLIDQQVTLSAEDKMHILSKVVSVRETKGEKLNAEMVGEAQRDLRASHTPSQFQPGSMTLDEALKVVAELAQFWLKGFDGSNLSYSAFKLQQSLQKVLMALKKPGQETEKETLGGLLQSLCFPAIKSRPEVNVEVSDVIISHRLEDHQNFAALFARETSWAACDERWLACLQKNPAAFQQLDTLIKLTSTVVAELGRRSCDGSRSKKLIRVVADIFSALPLDDKNKSLAAMLTLSPRGFFGGSVPSAVTDRFEQELNMAMNCIIQGGSGASAGSLLTAASLVATVAFQNPEATLRSCCHSAVFNKGAFSLMAKILQQLPGLTGRRVEAEGSCCSLLCSALQETVKTRSLSANDKEQFVSFLALLMSPTLSVEGISLRQSFLPPQEVVNIFVVPNLSTVGEFNI